MVFNRNAVVADFTRAMRNGRNRVAVGEVCWTMTQGSSLLATLGWGTESRWDSAWPRTGRASRLELFHRLDAPAANRRILGILADVHFPMPTTLAFLAVSFGN